MTATLFGRKNDVAKADELARVVDLIHGLEVIEGKFTQAIGLLAGLTVNDVLITETAVLNADGQWTRDFNVPYASILVGNLSGADLTVTSSPATNLAAPTVGPGVAIVPANSAGRLALAGTALTIYGPAGGRLTLTVLSRPVDPMLAGTSTITASSTGVATVTADQAVTNVVGDVLAANPARKAALIQNTGAQPIRVGPHGQVGGAQGLLVAAGATARVEQPYVPTTAWAAVRDAAATGNSTVAVVEIV